MKEYTQDRTRAFHETPLHSHFASFDKAVISRLNYHKPMVQLPFVNPPRVIVLPKLLSFFWMARPHFVAGSALVYTVGALVARSEARTLNWAAFVLGLAVVWLVQLATHFFNEYADREADAVNTHRTFFTGGSGVLQMEALSPRTALWAGTGTLLLAILLFFTLAALPTFGWLTVLVFGFAAVGATLYSVRPFALAYRWWGGFDTTLIAGFLTPSLAYILQTGRISPGLFLASLPLVVLVFAGTINTALPDFEADRAAGKRTLVVQLQPQRAAWLYTACLVVGYFLAVWVVPRSWPARLSGAVALFIGALSLYVLWGGGYRLPQRFELNTFLGLGAFFAVAATEAIGFWFAG
jgi:1,4-dihydroxy-2-naphthoate polyprenyltransferase